MDGMLSFVVGLVCIAAVALLVMAVCSVVGLAMRGTKGVRRK